MSFYRVRSTGEILSQGDLREKNPNVSFPINWDSAVCDFLGVDQIFDSPQPINNDPLKVVEIDGCIQDENGKWIQNWKIVDRFSGDDKQEKEDEFINLKWENIRSERNRRLEETDWRFRTDMNPSQLWIDYCQALRDITTQPDPFNITWPEKPNS